MPVSEEVAAAIAAYAPKGVDRAAWPEVAETARAAVTAAEPGGVAAARKDLAVAARFLLWAYQEGLPAETSVFAEAHLERFAATLEAGEASQATYRSRLRRVAAAVNPAGMPGRAQRQTRPRYRRQRLRPPYTPEEMAAFRGLVADQPTEARTRRLSALLALSAGAGLRADELRGLTAAAVRRDGDDRFTVVVDGPRARRVPVLTSYAGLLETALDGVDADTRVVTAGDGATAVNRLTDRLVGAADLPRLEIPRLRSTWLATLMAAPVPLAAILAAAGLTSANSLGDLVAHVADPVVAADEALRQAGRHR